MDIDWQAEKSRLIPFELTAGEWQMCAQIQRGLKTIMEIWTQQA